MFNTVNSEEKLTVSDNAAILCFVRVRIDDGTRWIGCKQYIASVRSKPKGVARAIECGKPKNPVWKMRMRHVHLLRAA